MGTLYVKNGLFCIGKSVTKNNMGAGIYENNSLKCKSGLFVVNSTLEGKNGLH